MRIYKDKIIEELGLRKFGQKGWLFNPSMECPFCGRSSKLGIFITEDVSVVNCFYCSTSTSLFKFLKKKNLHHLISKDSFENTIKYDQLTGFDDYCDVDEVEDEVSLPLGFRIIDRSDYLKRRKFLDYHYDLFRPGISTLEPNLTKDHIVFQIYNNHKRRGWIARSQNSYEWHKENLKQSKLGKERIILRYVNSVSDFSSIIGGYDEITEKTDTLIIVEGLFDKVSVDKELGLYLREEVKCIFTFGNKISDSQLKLLREKKNIKTIYLMYDYETIQQTRSTGVRLMNYFDIVRVCEINYNTDPGDMNQEEMFSILNKAKDPLQFYINRIF